MNQFSLLYDNARPHKGGSCSGGVDCSSLSSLQSEFVISILLLFGPLKDAPLGCCLADDNELKFSMPEELKCFSEELYALGLRYLMQSWKNCVCSEGDCGKIIPSL
jgi:hypothetical protein